MLVDTTKLLKEWAGSGPAPLRGPMSPAVINPPERPLRGPIRGPMSPAVINPPERPLRGPIRGPMSPAVINPPERSSGPAPLRGPVAPPEPLAERLKRRGGKLPLRGPVAPRTPPGFPSRLTPQMRAFAEKKSRGVPGNKFYETKLLQEKKLK